jgi:hypothetical protein
MITNRIGHGSFLSAAGDPGRWAYSHGILNNTGTEERLTRHENNEVIEGKRDEKHQK